MEGKKCIKKQALQEMAVREKCGTKKINKENRSWEKPVLEDVSGRVMAQPYIRFT